MKQTVRTEIGPVILNGPLGLPEKTRGLVLFVQGNGSIPSSPRNTFVARFL